MGISRYTQSFCNLLRIKNLNLLMVTIAINAEDRRPPATGLKGLILLTVAIAQAVKNRQNNSQPETIEQQGA